MKLFQKERSYETDVYKRTAGDYDLHAEIERAKIEMESAYTNFQNASDPDLIDCYIFAGNAAWKRYRFLLKQAKLL